MKLHKTYPIWLGLLVLVLAILACGPNPVQPVNTPVPPSQATPISNNPVPPGGASHADLIKATVQIYGLFNEGGQLKPKYSGSGTIISPTGMILTNAHVASPASQGDYEDEPDKLGILVIDQEDQPPVPTYYAEVKAVDGYLDLAVIQITATLDGTNINPSSLNLPYVQLGNSDDLHVGDPLEVIGYPGVGGKTITFTTGSVSGFTPEGNLGPRAWIKTDAGISGGNSGGLGASAAGLIIGVPTKLGSGTGSNYVDCRKIADTNGDGVINDKDTCVPVGELLNALRSINLALPLIRAVQAGQQYVPIQGNNTPSVPTPTAPQPPQPPSGGNESFTNLVWMSADINCDLQNEVTSYPTGTQAIAAAWNFNGMTNGEPWAVQYTLDGTEIYSKTYSWSSSVSSGQYSHCLTADQGFPDGSYHLSLFAGSDNKLLASADVVVGGGSNPPPPSNQGVISISGQIVDADSMNPLPGAEVYVLNPGVSFDQWKADQGSMSDVFTSTVADNQGYFALPDKLALNVSYTVVFYAEGYKLTVFADQVFDSSTSTDLQLLIKLTK